MGFFHRIEPLLYSRRNLVGSALALFGLGMLFLGVTSGVIGLGVVAGLYAIGYLVTPGERGVSLNFFSTQDTTDITKGLERLLASIRYRVSDDVFQKVGSIAYSIVLTLPNDGQRRRSSRPERQPDSSNRAQLPAPGARCVSVHSPYLCRTAIVDNGRRAHQILMDQFDLMDRRCRRRPTHRHERHRAAAVQRRFLQERFADSALELANAAHQRESAASSRPAARNLDPRTLCAWPKLEAVTPAQRVLQLPDLAQEHRRVPARAGRSSAVRARHHQRLDWVGVIAAFTSRATS